MNVTRQTGRGRPTGPWSTVLAALIGIFVLLVGVLAVPRSAAQGNTNDQLEQAQARLQDARDRERVLTADVEAYGQRIQAVESRLISQRERSEALARDLADLRVRLAGLTRDLAAERGRLAAARSALARRQVLLARRLRELYVRGEPDPILLLVESGSLSSALETADLIEGIADRDAGLADAVSTFADETRVRVARIADIRAEVVSSEARAEDAAEQALAAKSELERERAGLTELLEERRTLLSGVQGDRQELEIETRGLQARSARLAAAIRGAQEPTPAAPAPAPAQPAPAGGSGFIWPAQGTLTSQYGPRWGRMHEGIDIAGATGSPIVAARAGTVILAGWSGGYGNLVVVDHGAGISTAYAHNASVSVSVGQSVSQGSVLAGMGTTGNSTGVHSHFEIRINGAAVDPLSYL